MTIMTVPLKDFVNKKMLASATDQIFEAQKRLVAKAIVDSIPDIVRDSPVDTGLFAQSWDVTETEMSIILGNYAPHSPIIEFGARPFTPPLGPLLGWAKRVLQDPSQPPDYSKAVWALAVYTRSKIQREGMQPRGTLEKALPKIFENIREELSKL